MKTLRVVSLSLALALSVLASGCRIGNSSSTCAAGQSCVCDGIGNCDRDCPNGNCQFVCRGIGNCNVSCAGGGCSMSCMGTGNCTLDCAGGGCTTSCNATGNCLCPRGCGPVDGGTRDQ